MTSDTGSPDTSDAPESDATIEPTIDASPAAFEADGGPRFESLGLSPALLESLTALGYEEPTPIQCAAIPAMLEGKDLLGQAATGTGKTAAFALPLLEQIVAQGAGNIDQENRPVRALVLVPTRELAIQVAEAFHRYGRKAFGVNVLPVYGGQAIQQQLRALRRGVDIVVATPGRALDHIGRGSLDLSSVCVVVLDEADEMLDMGFADDLEAILAALPEKRQTALFSATMARRVAAIAERHLTDPVRIVLGREQVPAGETPRVRQIAYIVRRPHKVAALGRVLDMEDPSAAIVFCRTRTEVDELVETLAGRGYRAEALHGGLSQEQRDRVMRRFRDGTTELLIATDVAARGLDVEHVSHVVNFDVPTSPEAYVHRIGRTGRAGRSGVAITFAEPREHRFLRNIEHTTKLKIALENVPTIVDLRARRMELTKESLREALTTGELEQYRVIIESLAEEFEPMDVALAAVKLAHQAEHADDQEDDADIPTDTRDGGRDNRSGMSRPPRQEYTGGSGPSRERYPSSRSARSDGPRESSRSSTSRDSGPSGPRSDKRRDRAEGTTSARGRGREIAPLRPAEGRNLKGHNWPKDVTRIYIGLGRRDGMRPADVVGAIANEAHIPTRDIGAIDIADSYSLVEVPGEAVETIIRTLRGTTLRGKKVLVKLDRGR